MSAFKDVLWKCSLRSLKENKGRTLVTVLGVALATGLITAMACILSSLLASYIGYLKKTEGEAHAIFQGVERENLTYFVNNKSVEGTWIARREGYVCLGKLRYKNVMDYLEVLAVSPDWFAHHDKGVQLCDGRFPVADNEIVVDKRLHTELRMDVMVGDEITLAVGRRYLGGQEVALGMSYEDGEEVRPDFEKTYVVVGLTDGLDRFSTGLNMMGRRSKSRDVYADVYPAFTYMDEGALLQDIRGGYADGNGELTGNGRDALYDVSLRYTKQGLRQYKEVNAALLDITPQLYERVFVRDYVNPQDPSEEERALASGVAKGLYLADGWLGLIALESNQLMNQGTYMFIGMLEIVFLVILLTGVFCINNSFDLTFTERVRFYGMMSSIGTTKRQRRTLVLYEGVVIGAFGIPLGILLGVLFTFGIVQFTNLMLSGIEKNILFSMVFCVRPLPILIAVLLSAFMIWLSAAESAARAARVMPMEAIRLTDIVTAGKAEAKKNAKKTKKTKKTNGWNGRLFKRFFGAAGNMAVKNYDRSRIKYRGSVTSIVLSAALIIGMSFAWQIYEVLGNKIWEGTNCQLTVSMNNENSWWETFQDLNRFAKDDEGISTTEIASILVLYDMEDELPFLPGKPNAVNSSGCYIKILNRDAFERLCVRAGVDPQEAKEKGIVNCAEVKKGPTGLKEPTGESLAQFQTGDIVSGDNKYNFVRNEDGTWENDSAWVDVEIACQADDVFPISEPFPIGAILIYVSEDWVEAHPQLKSLTHLTVAGYFLGDDVSSFEDKLYEADFNDLYTMNYDREYKRLKYAGILVITLLGSFLGVIMLIGVTNVINAIGTNLELRAPEFARLRAIGMSRKELRKMIRLEVAILGGKGLIYGFLIGTGVSYGLYRFLWESSDKVWDFAYRIPLGELGICAVLVGGGLLLITERSIKRLENKNIVETIRNENL